MADEEIKKETTISMGNMKLFFCNICNECYSQERSFKLHYRAHKNFTCDTCGKVFFLKRKLTVHSRSHDKKVYTCEICNKNFNHKSGLKKHVRIHDVGKSLICDVCKSTFRREVELKEHYSTHAVQGPYVCDICDTCFLEKSSLQEHTFMHITKKNNSNKVKDPIEGKIVKDSELKNSESNHKGIAKHKCDICEKDFKTKTLLKNHCRIHKGKKSLKGNISERALNELPSSTNCTVEKPHVCEMCKKVFKTKTLLKNHCHIHKGKKSCKGNITERTLSELPSSTNRTVEKPHVCDFCEKSFSRKSSLLSHDCTMKRKA